MPASPSFYDRRALRILPGLRGFLIGLGVLLYLQRVAQPSQETWLASWFYFRIFSGDGWDNVHLWSLSLEEQFYALWPVALSLLRRRNGRLPTIVAVSIVLTFRRLAVPHSFDSILYRPDLRLDTFLIGAAFGLGLFSHSTYLCQQLFLAPHFQLWSLPALAVVAYASHRLIECPLLSLKDHIPGTRAQPSPLLAAHTLA